MVVSFLLGVNLIDWYLLLTRRLLPLTPNQEPLTQPLFTTLSKSGLIDQVVKVVHNVNFVIAFMLYI